MVHLKVSVLILFLATLEQTLGSPGHHVHHRIHVPTKIKTVYHTKIIKIPEHHHYFHEKEKPHLVKVPEHHHYFHEKEKEKPLDLHSYHPKEEDLDLQNDWESDHKNYDFEEGHNIFKKHAPAHHYKKRRPKPKH
ncbi:histidine-rich glycoprotein-like [Tribolium madens]|uniref:histidine-rich glycoprotein-like n=1 Tax=Tribolium madens TaxID=41895 RepID=UPI001CF75B74|nr:histidine-rich glycoprotein-like [Tribolium madens]